MNDVSMSASVTREFVRSQHNRPGDHVVMMDDTRVDTTSAAHRCMTALSNAIGHAFDISCVRPMYLSDVINVSVVCRKHERVCAATPNQLLGGYNPCKDCVS